jgi:hypothetical protein
MPASANDGTWRLVREKRSPFFGAAMYTGVVCGEASTKTAIQEVILRNRR